MKDQASGNVPGGGLASRPPIVCLKTPRSPSSVQARVDPLGLREVLDAIDSVIITLSPDQRILEWNDEAARIHGFKRQDVLGRNYFRLFIPGKFHAGIAEDVRRVMSGKPTQPRENPVRCADGQERVLAWHVKPIVDVSGVVRKVVVCGHDITRRQLVEAELRLSRQTLRDLAYTQDQIVENERLRLSRRIHDDLGQSLTSLRMGLYWLEERLQAQAETATAPMTEKLASMHEQVWSTLEGMRQIATELRPAILDALDLAATFEWEARRFEEQSGIACCCEGDRDLVVPEAGQRTAIFRIFKELLANVACHAQATRVQIVLTREEDALVLALRDNGVGIRKAQIDDPASLGILGMRERAANWRGELSFRTSPEGGTIATLRMPLAQARKTTP